MSLVLFSFIWNNNFFFLYSYSFYGMIHVDVQIITRYSSVSDQWTLQNQRVVEIRHLHATLNPVRAYFDSKELSLRLTKQKPLIYRGAITLFPGGSYKHEKLLLYNKPTITNLLRVWFYDVLIFGWLSFLAWTCLVFGDQSN